ncbi:uncharacterized protein BDW70DRAFT_166993 [Aspergillus foveolatus]|uniref:uncharacterized protein n=1 Tax=Aspergillus foveolatus TaxID=210207 RepID=UPI003CCD029B
MYPVSQDLCRANAFMNYCIFIVAGDPHEFDPEKWTCDRKELPKRHSETNISVLIGHNVVGILERSQGPNYSRDLIIIQPSAVAVMRHWQVIYGPSVPSYNDPEHLAEREGFPFVGPVQIRKEFFQMLLRPLAKVGLKVDYGCRVDRYFEDEAAGLGGVVLDNGTIRGADLVVAADAFRSRSELLVAGEHMPTRPSGMSVYRSALPRSLTLDDEVQRQRWGNGALTKDSLLEDSTPPVESRNPDVNPEDAIMVLRRVPDWDPAIEALVRAPRGAVIHWPLLWRNLRPHWTSKGARCAAGRCSAFQCACVSGKCHSAIEDAVTLATCLQLAGSAPLGARVYNLLRYQRVSTTQKMAFVNSQLLNASTTDWDAIHKDSKQVRLRFPKWVFRHDPETYAYEKYKLAFAHLVAGAEFHNTNFPASHKFIAQGKRVEDILDGDWLLG